MKIFIDADGCPVVDTAVKIAKENNIECIIVTDTAHHFCKNGAKTITVSTGADSADFALVNLLERNDIAITQDYGLAAMCLAKGAYPINQNGLVFDSNNIDSLLLARHAAKKLRKSGKHRLKGPSKRTKQQDTAFEKSLRKVIADILCK